MDPTKLVSHPDVCDCYSDTSEALETPPPHKPWTPVDPLETPTELDLHPMKLEQRPSRPTGIKPDLAPNHPIQDETVLVNAYIEELAARYNIQVIDFNKIGRKHFTRHGQHLSMRGKRLMAEMVVGCLLELRPAPAGPRKPARPPHVTAATAAALLPSCRRLWLPTGRRPTPLSIPQDTSMSPMPKRRGDRVLQAVTASRDALFF
ncbi:hypothetical protein J6590_023185 [Homalodisca vitripennis]|nr:hypothetical protein J6590_023185 [Homalodisca vitripennis]